MKSTTLSAAVNSNDSYEEARHYIKSKVRSIPDWLRTLQFLKI